MPRFITVALISLILLSGCRKPAQIPPTVNGQANDAAGSINEFAVDLYRELATDEGNLFFSPASIATAMTMTWDGARGETAAEMSTVLHLNPKKEKVFSDYHELLRGLAGSDSTYTIRAANRIWGQEGFPFKSAFLFNLETYFSGGFESVDFSGNAEEERQVINHWVADQTEDKIQNLMPAGSVNRDTRLVLTNAVYFLSEWLYPFPEHRTKKVDFHTAEGTTVKTPTMKLAKDLPYYANDSLAMVALPYAGDDLEFLIILPHEQNGLAKVEAELSAASLDENIQAMNSQKMNVWLPRLDLAQNFSLNSVLNQMGIKKAFSQTQADFLGISENDGLFISSVVHKSFLKVDEKGTEAAAATGVSIGVTSMPPQADPPTPFIADHPFLFMIRQKATGLILFMGRMNEPAA